MLLVTAILALFVPTPQTEGVGLPDAVSGGSLKQEVCDIWKNEGDDYMFGITCAITIEESGVSQGDSKAFMEANQPHKARCSSFASLPLPLEME